MKASSTTCVVHPPRRRNFKALLAAALIALMPPLAPVSAAPPAPELSHELTRLDPPRAAPDFTLQDMDDNSHSMRDYRGKVVMLNFWATWCPPCRREIPSMESIYQDLREDGFVVLAVNQFETPDHVFAYMGQLDVFPNFPILFDPDSSISQLYAVKGLPTTLLIDKDGQVVYRAIGGRDFDHPEVREIVRELIDAARQP